ncbi:MAG TPA: hypothetical protein VJ739_15610 [Gemmataceae bacterium]|nr:hypothetical protein [Gemmataceae bacterium]
MTSDEATAAVIDALNAEALPYMLVGSFASNFYGVPRATQDADFVLQLGATPVSALAQRLAPAFRLDPQLSFETITGTTRHTLQLAEGPFQVELFLLSEDAHDRERFARRRRVRALGRDVWMPTAEDVVITKLRWAVQGQRAKDVDDVRNVIAVQGERLDWGYVNRWCDLHATRELLDRVRNSIPPD